MEEEDIYQQRLSLTVTFRDSHCLVFAVGLDELAVDNGESERTDGVDFG